MGTQKLLSLPDRFESPHPCSLNLAASCDCSECVTSRSVQNMMINRIHRVTNSYNIELRKFNSRHGI